MSQRLEDYWLGLRLQKIDIPALQLVKSDDVSDMRATSHLASSIPFHKSPSINESWGAWSLKKVCGQIGTTQRLEPPAVIKIAKVCSGHVADVFI